MKRLMKIPLVIGFLLPITTIVKADIFLENDSLDILSKNFYFYRDFRNGGFNPSGANKFEPIEDKEGYRSEWAQGFIFEYDSGYQELWNDLYIGTDIYSLLGLKLYSDPYKTGTNLLEIDQNGKAESYYGEVGASLKLKYKDTELKYGNQFPNVPVISVSTVRLLPSVATGLTLSDNSFENLNLNAGYFYSMNPVDSTKDLNYFTTDYGVGIKSDSISYLGGSFKKDNTSMSLFFSELKDVWYQTYFSTAYKLNLADSQSMNASMHVYNNNDAGARLAGDISTTLISPMLKYTIDKHAISLGYQEVFGDEPMDWVGFSTMGANIWFSNAAQFATFSEANEKSVQIRYDVDLSSFIPGLSFFGRYLYGWDMDNSSSKNSMYLSRYVYDKDTDYKHWERDLQLNYNVQSGFAKGLDIKLRQATHRATPGYRYNDIDEVRLIFEYPFSF